MGHDVNYEGLLKFKNSLTEEQKHLIGKCQNDNIVGENFNYFYSLKLNEDNAGLEFTYNQKIYPWKFFPVIRQFAEKFKELGNDFEEGSYLISKSEYEMQEEDFIFVYIKGEFIQKLTLEVCLEYIRTLKQ